jgi:hypothetical protein
MASVTNGVSKERQRVGISDIPHTLTPGVLRHEVGLRVHQDGSHVFDSAVLFHSSEEEIAEIAPEFLILVVCDPVVGGTLESACNQHTTSRGLCSHSLVNDVDGIYSREILGSLGRAVVVHNAPESQHLPHDSVLVLSVHRALSKNVKFGQQLVLMFFDVIH